MVEIAHAGLDDLVIEAAVERRRRQRESQFGGQLQGLIHVLALGHAFAAGLERILDHAQPVDFQNAGIGEAALERSADSGRVRAGLFRQGQGLGDGADVEADNDLVGGLGDLAGANGADMGGGLAQHVEN